MKKCSNGHPEIYHEVFLDGKPTICPICQLLILYQKRLMDVETILKQLYFKGRV